MKATTGMVKKKIKKIQKPKNHRKTADQKSVSAYWMLALV